MNEDIRPVSVASDNGIRTHTRELLEDKVPFQGRKGFL